ncbi:ras-like GTP-binding protein ypt1 [Plakobranchus ocellatus]|uniref:Ras-like GTP-binding protein ypt1 n=1 Tax=Plakobranchus ocellatus TaxID=259542 RepID=A0AAV3YIT2_9GAST|nr:ras-like GTP-binding protein ypt1 [Plakobranchus ocellatus]
MVKDAGNDNSGEKGAQRKAFDYLFKVVVGGADYVGKTCLIQRYAQGHYQDSYMATIGIDFVVREHETKNGKHVKLQVWDLAGQERFRNITLSYLRGARGVLLVYDITNRESFTRIPYELDEVHRMAIEDIVIVLVGNKADLNDSKRQVTFEEGQEFAEANGLTFYEASARDDINVNELFDHFVHLLVDKYIETHSSPKTRKGAEILLKQNASNRESETKAKSKFCIIL